MCSIGLSHDANKEKKKGKVKVKVKWPKVKWSKVPDQEERPKRQVTMDK